MNVFQFLHRAVINPSSHDYGTFKYLLPFILVSTVALWLLPGLLAKATGRLVSYFSRRALRGAASSDVVLESGPDGGYSAAALQQQMACTIYARASQHCCLLHQTFRLPPSELHSRCSKPAAARWAI
jgi:hypothetical protein